MSVQQARYLALRADGAEPVTAAVAAGISIGEAHLMEAALERGELSIPAAGSAAQSGGRPTMAQKAKPGDGDRVTNLSETKDIIRNTVPRIVNLKKQRKQINEEIASEREKVNAAGVPKAALDHAIRLKEMDPEDRQAFDEGVAIVRDSIHVPMSRSLFDMLDEDTGAKDEDGEKGEKGQEESGSKPKSAGAALEAARAKIGDGAKKPVPDAVH